MTTSRRPKAMCIIAVILLAVSLLLLFRVSNSPPETFVKNIEPVWTYWETPGASKAGAIPQIVQRCYRNWKTIGRVNDIKFLNPSNITPQFIPIEDMKQIEKASNGNIAVKSDFIGLYILNKFGGTMIDGTVYMHKPLSSWLPDAIGNSPFFCFNGQRYARGDGEVCPETFFMHADRNSKVAKDWYDLAMKVGLSGEKGREAFVRKIKKKYPKIDDNFADGGQSGNNYYLWMYLVGKYLFLENPNLKKLMKTLPSEDDPLKAIKEAGWQTDATCESLKRPQSTNLTKLDNGLWRSCPPSIVPVQPM